MSSTKISDKGWVQCPTCDTEREVIELVRGCCPFCDQRLINIPKAPLPERIDIPSIPKPRAPARKVKLTEQKPEGSSVFYQEPSGFKLPTNEQRIEAEEEAYRMPYAHPTPQIDANIEKELAQRVLCRRKLMPFIQRFRPKYKAGWVHQDICRRLEKFVKDVEDGKEPRLLLMMPPRSGKSEIGSRHLPAWVLGKHPEWEIIAGSHTSSLTMSFSRYVRDLIRDPAYTAIYPETTLDPSSSSVENWNIVGGGGYLAAGVGTGITGRGAHILLLDDLVKDMEAADSPTIRENTWEWYCSTAYTRLAPGGGVLGIMCMTGDTPVLMADGTEKRLDTLNVRDEIATYENGRLSTSTIRGLKSNGLDSCLKITMSSGRIVRSNGRHPFLATHNGELKWIRARSLTTANRIVTVKVNGESGKEQSALQGTVTRKLYAEDTVSRTMPRSDGLTDIEVQQTLMLKNDALHESNTGTVSPWQNTTSCSLSKVESAPSVETGLLPTSPSTGESIWQSIIATTQARYEDCSVTTATQGSDILNLSPLHVPQPDTSDFTLERIVSIEHDGIEEVFDLSVYRTENFIANLCVTHNTWWNEDDWAGRIQQVMETGEGDKFEIIKYPAINEEGDEYMLDEPGEPIVQFPKERPVPETATLTRLHNTAIHPDRYTTEAMNRIKANLKAAGQLRVWQALYQQNPTPDSGIHFTKDMFRYYGTRPALTDLYIYQAWDFAITEDEQNDFIVGITVAVDHRDWAYVLDMKRFKSSDGILIAETVVDYAKEWNVTAVGVEDGQIWKSIKSSFDKYCETLHYWPDFEVLVPLTDKMVRAGPLKGRMQAGKVLFDSTAPYFQIMLKELLFFPAGKHDDIVDALAWVIRLVLMRSAPKQPQNGPRKLKSWKDNLQQYQDGGDATHMAA